jgi:Protein of unknown function (DUF1353)
MQGEAFPAVAIRRFCKVIHFARSRHMIARRSFLASSSGLLAAASACFLRNTARADAPVFTEEQTRLIEWMDAATGVGREIARGTLSVTRFGDAYWYLNRGIDWSPGQGQSLPAVSVPKGFVTDFASIPRALWVALPRDGDYVWAAVVHDYLYWYQTTTKDVADDVLNAAMIDFKIPAADRIAIFEGVRLGGASSWIENAQLRQRGEKRILTLFPDDPTITWEDWKKRPGVFGP